MAAGFVVLIVFGVLVALALKYHLYTRYVHPKLFPQDDIEAKDGKQRREVSVILLDLKRILGMKAPEPCDEESKASETGEIDVHLQEFYEGRISNKTQHALSWWRFVGLTKALEAWVLSTQTSKKQKAKMEKFNSLVKSPRPSAALLDGNEPSGENPKDKDNNADDEGTASGEDKSTVDDISADAHSSEEDGSQDGDVDRDDTKGDGGTKSRGLRNLPVVDDEALGPLPPNSSAATLMSDFDRKRMIETMTGRSSTFASTRTLEERLGALSDESFRSGAAKVSADLIYHMKAGMPKPYVSLDLEP